MILATDLLRALAVCCCLMNGEPALVFLMAMLMKIRDL